MKPSAASRTVLRSGRPHRRTATTRPVYGPDVQPSRSAADGAGITGAITEDAWDRALTLLRGDSKIVLACHLNPDGDALGSMLATGLGLRQLGISVQASFSNPFRLPQSLTQLAGRELLVPPEQVVAEPDVLVTFDTGSVDRLGDLAPLVAAAGDVIVVDHHITNGGFGTHNLIDPQAAATAVVVDDLLARLGVRLDAAIAECLYVGLSTDTASFRGAATSPSTHELAARLLATGIRPDEISRRLYDARPVRSLHLLADVLGRVVLEPGAAGGAGLSWSYVTQDDLARHGVGMEWVEGVVDMIRGAEESTVAMVAKQTGPGEWSISLRSRGPVDVGALSVRLGGGGHRLAAGFTGRGPLEGVVDALRTALDAVPVTS
ncbi:phosphoesterase RecJ domain-containing protein [Cryptosporangium aurantiacum]|uniref:Phosphoesterase RecJ domain-containing protein n=1 Tax=Cryptosporangium aurantiacum TaxID=134849 RepID=A0A1M7IPP5_9ACTN|nr:bifunctional oligoribonuclease/PAP phosphatase NrnA [Cryptosporangium aurantiacum]SHM42665.1 phosphoesterase RecJ domain-containing protein [Cryptosporangium aurantiacum]